jgi:tetratricopeptide (TPR) repeat protein
MVGAMTRRETIENNSRGMEDTSATDVPSPTRAAELVAEGERAEQLGALDRAILSFSEAARSADPEIAAEAFARLADAHRSRAEWSDALSAARRGQRVARAANREVLYAHALIAEGNVHMCRGEFREAKDIFEKVLTLTDDSVMRGHALQNMGSVLAQQGQLGAAERAFAESYGNFQRAGYRRGEATALNNYGRAALDRGDLALAADLLEQAVDIAREVDHGELIALATLNLAEAKARSGDTEGAHHLASIALGFFSGSGNRWREIEGLRLVGAINEQCGSLDDAARCYERGLRLAQELGALTETGKLSECLDKLRQRM